MQYVKKYLENNYHSYIYALLHQTFWNVKLTKWMLASSSVIDKYYGITVRKKI